MIGLMEEKLGGVSSKNNNTVLTTEDKKLLDRIKEVIGEIDRFSTLNIDDGVLTAVRRSLEMACKFIQSTPGSNLSYIHDTLDRVEKVVKYKMASNICIPKTRDMLRRYLTNNDLFECKSLFKAIDSTAKIYLCEQTININGLPTIVVLYYDFLTKEHIFIRASNGKIDKDFSFPQEDPLSLEILTQKIEDKIKEENCLSRLANV
jgi:hypothetical protein